MEMYITGKVAIGLCDWIYDDMRDKVYNRAKFNTLLRLARKYNAHNPDDISRWVYDPDKQRLKFYCGTCIEKAVCFKEQTIY